MVRQAERRELSVKIALPTGTDHCDSRLKVVLFPEGSLVNKEVMGMLLSSMKKFLLIYSQKLIFFSLITCKATLQQNYQPSLTT